MPPSIRKGFDNPVITMLQYLFIGSRLARNGFFRFHRLVLYSLRCGARVGPRIVECH
ncbi:hypothetical protein MTBLM5_560002 [Magnetospirillum sp. LM-5]|nr:hypothetical protein MTBLM5_560002 [Magnetospirillum sp. LM-5]